MNIEAVTKGSLGQVKFCFEVCFVDTIIFADLLAYTLYEMADKIIIWGVEIPVIRPLAMFFLFLFCLRFFILQPLVLSYLVMRQSNNDFIEKNYVWPNKSLISLPEKKKNPVFFILESLETTFSSKENGGFFYKDLIPELSKLAKENVHFSNTYRLGGGYNTASATFTVGANFAMLTGLPLKDVNDYRRGFMPLVYGGLDFLDDNGYNNYFFNSCLVGNLYKLDLLYKTHGNATTIAAEHLWEKYPQNIYDYDEWGANDFVLYQGIKDFLKEKSNEADKKPFAAVIGTMDTHFPFGYLCKNCPKNNPSFRYLDTYSCMSKQVNDVIEYAKSLSIYNYTVFVIVGDHLTMSNDIEMIINKNDPNYKRRVFNTIINPSGGIPPDSITQKRVFNSFDWFPTILAALGFKIKGERLGLGTNLFSGMKTLSEKYGKNKFNNQIKAPTNFIKEKFITNQQNDDIYVEFNFNWR